MAQVLICYVKVVRLPKIVHPEICDMQNTEQDYVDTNPDDMS